MNAAAGGVQPSGSLRSFSHRDFSISYPDNWQVFGDQNSAVTIAPQNGVSQNAVAYGIMINTYQPEDANASLDQATHELLASLRQSNPDLRAIGHDENIRVNGVAGKSVDLVGNSPLRDQSGRAESGAGLAGRPHAQGWHSVVCRLDRSRQGFRSAAPDV